jgi:hypothetical protein
MAIAGRPVEPAIGSMRVNTTTNNIEVYEGTCWVIRAPGANPETWEDWLKRYATDMGETLTVRRDYIYKSMQARFPGNYDVVQVAGDWQLVFATPQDETWFHLQHG